MTTKEQRDQAEAVSIINDLRSTGFKLVLKGGKIGAAPPDKVTPEIAARIKTQYASIQKILEGESYKRRLAIFYSTIDRILNLPTRAAQLEALDQYRADHGDGAWQTLVATINKGLGRSLYEDS